MALPTSGYDTFSVPAPQNSGSHTDFTFIIDLSNCSASFKSAWDTDLNGKGRASKDSGPTELSTDWIDLDYSARTGFVRVRWSGTWSASATIRIYPPLAANATIGAADTYGSDDAYDSDLVIYWPLEEDPSGSAPQATDRTSNENHGTSDGSMTSGDLVTGQVGSGWDLDGSNDAIKDSSAVLGPNSQCTVLAWCEWSSASGDCIVGSDSGFEFALRRDGTNLQFILNSFSSNDRVSSSASPTGGSTYHVGGRFDGTNLETIINGSPDGSVTPGGSWGGQTGFWAGKFSTTGSYWDGWLDEIQIHSTGRSDDWIKEEYDQTKDNSKYWGPPTWNAGGGGVTVPALDEGMLVGGLMALGGGLA